MKISARNQLCGNVLKIEKGAVNDIVLVDIGNGNKVSSTISMDAVNELGITEGSKVTAVIKATSVMIATSPLKISARNQFPGKVAEIKEGAVNDIVVVDIAGGHKIYSTISKNSVKDLGIKVGSNATAVAKSTSVMLAAD